MSSTVGQQRAGVQSLANQLTPSNLKRAIAGIRPSEADHLIQMLHDAVQTLSNIPDPRQPKREPQW